ncbi:hypothetical protein [Streptomyces werraensis]|uniref:hypothetical protein n=1 Tax=Streptomyces werraensis TaxID=68284 RepID=UPI00341C85D3
MRIIPLAYLESGDDAPMARARWVVFATDFPPGTPAQDVGECSRSKAEPLHFARVEHRNKSGRLTGTSLHPNLLSPASFARARFHGVSLTRPGFFINEIGG